MTWCAARVPVLPRALRRAGPRPAGRPAAPPTWQRSRCSTRRRSVPTPTGSCPTRPAPTGRPDHGGHDRHPGPVLGDAGRGACELRDLRVAAAVPGPASGSGNGWRRSTDSRSCPSRSGRAVLAPEPGVQPGVLLGVPPERRTRSRLPRVSSPASTRRWSPGTPPRCTASPGGCSTPARRPDPTRPRCWSARETLTPAVRDGHRDGVRLPGHERVQPRRAGGVRLRVRARRAARQHRVRRRRAPRDRLPAPRSSRPG